VNPASFQSLVHEWYDPLFRFALSLCSDRERALDLTQNAFYKLAARPESLRDPTRAKTWLFSVVHREFIDQYRHRTRFPSTHLEGVPETPDPSANPRARSLDREAVLRALQALDETFRAPLSLFYLQSHSYREIAAILDIPMGTVMSRLRRGKDRLRNLLESGVGEAQEESREDPIEFPQRRIEHE
jgi:RNA polymerase sigma-70 factor (ECF subfamily)